MKGLAQAEGKAAPKPSPLLKDIRGVAFHP
jgi:hypothetical protein